MRVVGHVPAQARTCSPRCERDRSSVTGLGEQRPQAGAGGLAAEPSPHGVAGAVDVGAVGVEVEVPVRRQQCGLELERHLRRIGAGAAALRSPGRLGRPAPVLSSIGADTPRCGPGPDPRICCRTRPWRPRRSTLLGTPPVRHRTGRRRTARAGAGCRTPTTARGLSPHGRSAAAPPRWWRAAAPPWSRSVRTTRSCSSPTRSRAVRWSGLRDRRRMPRRRRSAGSCLVSWPQHVSHVSA